MRKTFGVVAVVAALWVWACDEEGPILTETGVVEETPYRAGQTSTGISSSGDTVFVSAAPSYTTVFRCDAHNVRFAISGTDSRHKALWGKFPKGQRVTIFYRNVQGGCSPGVRFVDAEALP